MHTICKLLLGLVALCLFGCGKDEVPDFSLGSVTDADGNRYTTIVIEGMEWMAENLRSTVFCDGETIAAITTNNQWGNANGPARATYRNLAANGEIYGMLYNWAAVSDDRNMCPCGWKVPSDADWTALITALDAQTDADVFGEQSLRVGGQLKSTGTVENEDGLWRRVNTGAADVIGFSGLPAGCRGRNGLYHSIGTAAFWWSSSVRDEGEAFARYVVAGSGSVNRAAYPFRAGFSVRCIKG